MQPAPAHSEGTPGAPQRQGRPTTSAGSPNSGIVNHLAGEYGLLGASGGRQVEKVLRSGAHVGEALVLGLAAVPAHLDLLEDHRHLERGVAPVDAGSGS